MCIRDSGYIAPVISGFGLLAVLVLAVINFAVLTGASKLLSYSLTGLLLVGAVVGVALALRLKTKEPERYLTIGHEKF